MGERVFFNHQSKIYHAQRDSILRWHCVLEVTDELPQEVDVDTVQYLLDATDHVIERDLQRLYSITPSQSRQILLDSMAAVREEEQIRRATVGYANQA